MTHRLFKEGSAVAIGSALAIVGRLVGIRLITSAVGPTIYGEAVLLTGVATLASAIFCAPLLQGALRFYPDAARQSRLPAFRREIARLVRLPVAIIGVVLVVAGALWSRTFSTTLGFAAAALLLAADATRLISFNYLNAARRQARYAKWLAFDSWARPVVAVCLVWATHPSAAAVLAGTALAALFAAVGARTRSTDDTQATPLPDHDLRVVLVAFALPLVPTAVLGWVTNIGDRYVLASLRGAAETGIYAAVYGLMSQPFIAASTIAVATLRPVIFEASATHDVERSSHTLRLWLGIAALVGVLGVAIAWLLGPVLIRIMLGQSFVIAAPIAPWIAGAYALQGFQQVFETQIYAARKTGALLLLQVVSATAASAGYLLLIPPMGMMGAALASCAALACSCAASIAIVTLTKKR